MVGERVKAMLRQGYENTLNALSLAMEKFPDIKFHFTSEF